MRALHFACAFVFLILPTTGHVTEKEFISAAKTELDILLSCLNIDTFNMVMSKFDGVTDATQKQADAEVVKKEGAHKDSVTYKPGGIVGITLSNMKDGTDVVYKGKPTIELIIQLVHSHWKIILAEFLKGNVMGLGVGVYQETTFLEFNPFPGALHLLLVLSVGTEKMYKDAGIEKVSELLNNKNFLPKFSLAQDLADRKVLEIAKTKNPSAGFYSVNREIGASTSLLTLKFIKPKEGGKPTSEEIQAHIHQSFDPIPQGNVIGAGFGCIEHESGGFWGLAIVVTFGTEEIYITAALGKITDICGPEFQTVLDHKAQMLADLHAIDFAQKDSNPFSHVQDLGDGFYMFTYKRFYGDECSEQGIVDRLKTELKKEKLNAETETTYKSGEFILGIGIGFIKQKTSGLFNLILVIHIKRKSEGNVAEINGEKTDSQSDTPGIAKHSDLAPGFAQTPTTQNNAFSSRPGNSLEFSQNSGETEDATIPGDVLKELEEAFTEAEPEAKSASSSVESPADIKTSIHLKKEKKLPILPVVMPSIVAKDGRMPIRESTHKAKHSLSRCRNVSCDFPDSEDVFVVIPLEQDYTVKPANVIEPLDSTPAQQTSVSKMDSNTFNVTVSPQTVTYKIIYTSAEIDATVWKVTVVKPPTEPYKLIYRSEDISLPARPVAEFSGFSENEILEGILTLNSMLGITEPIKWDAEAQKYLYASWVAPTAIENLNLNGYKVLQYFFSAARTLSNSKVLKKALKYFRTNKENEFNKLMSDKIAGVGYGIRHGELARNQVSRFLMVYREIPN